MVQIQARDTPGLIQSCSHELKVKGREDAEAANMKTVRWLQVKNMRKRKQKQPRITCRRVFSNGQQTFYTLVIVAVCDENVFANHQYVSAVDHDQRPQYVWPKLSL